MSEDFLDVVWLGDQAIIYGWDSEGAFRRRDLTGFEMERLSGLEAKHNAALQKLLAEFMGEPK